MSTDYRIKAYPTSYRGRLYRSRLEARWAAFFDRLGWTAEYEPVDLGSWSPDFQIRNTENGISALVEVKPIKEIDTDIVEKMLSACDGIEDYESGLLLVGISPFIIDDRVVLGWFCSGDSRNRGLADWRLASMAWFSLCDEPRYVADIPIELEWEKPVVAGALSLMRVGWESPFTDYTMRLWAAASNAVQWRGEGREP